MTPGGSTDSSSPAVQAVQLVVIVAVLMWLIEAADAVLLGNRLDGQGIAPRTLSGLDGILWAPFLHGGFGHLSPNTIPFLILGSFVAMAGLKRWLAVTAMAMVGGGLATWLLARPAVHMGAAGLVFGCAGYLLIAGFVEKAIKGVAVVVGILFGGMVIRGVTSVSSDVSWESHVFGLTAGVIAAFALAAPEGERVAG